MSTISAIGTNVCTVGGSAFSWSAYWAGQSEVLFFGEVSKITGGKLYNQKIGATDYLTVTGAAGSYTFQCPNTAPYIAADTDKIWFTSTPALRTVTTIELISYDFTWTIIKYDNTTPYAIRWIMILSSDLETARENKMRDSFELSIWWSNVLSSHGTVKGNRSTGQSVYIVEANDLFNRMIAVAEPPDMTRRLLIQNTIAALKSNSLWTKFDAIWTPAAHGISSYRFNWLQDAYNLTDGAAPAFETDRGITGDGSTTYLKTGVTPSAGGFKFKKDDASYGFYSRTNNAATVYDMGYYHATVGRSTINARSAIDYFQTYVNGQSAQSIANTNSIGFFCAVRNSSTTVSTYKNKVKTDANNNSSGTASEIYILTCNNGGSPSGLSERQQSFAFAGGKLTESEVNLLYDIMVDGYLNSIGAKI